jgi:hypothetical protein
LKSEAPRAGAPAGNEGVGEHVRTKSQPANRAAEIADLWIRADEENYFLLPVRFSRRASLSKSIQPFDLMSRRHPLSSTRAFRFQIRFEKQTVLRLV